MKKIVMAMAMLLASMSGMAQDADQGKNRPERKKFSQAEMIQHRTDQTVKRYGLDENQAKQLQELNTKYASVMGGPRGERGFRPQGQRPEKAERDSVKRQRPSREDMEKRRAEMDAYRAELQKIMTAEQFKSYQADVERMMKNGRHRPQGHQPRRNNEN